MRRAMVAFALGLLIAGCGSDPPAKHAAPRTGGSAPAAHPAKPKVPAPSVASQVATGLTVTQVSDRLGGPREIKPQDRPNCLYWSTTDAAQEIEVCFTNAADSRSTSARLVPATP